MFEFLFKKKRSLSATDYVIQDVTSIDEPIGTMFRFKSESAPDIQEVDDRFIAMLLGINSLEDGEPGGVEKKALQQIRRWTELEHLPENIIPRLPSIIPKIMIALRREDTSAQDIADLISKDLSLVGEVIRLSDSAFYRSGHKVKSLKQAIQKMGQEGIRQLIYSAAFKPIMSSNKGKIFPVLGHILWQKNQKAAIAADYLSLTTEDDRFHAYLVGLFSHCGMLIVAKELEESFNASNIPRSRQFMREIDDLSKRISIQIGGRWEMPQEIVLALDDQLSKNAPNGISSLGQVGYVADRLAKISLLEERNELMEMEAGVLCRVGRIQSSTCRKCYSLINRDQLPDT